MSLSLDVERSGAPQVDPLGDHRQRCINLTHWVTDLDGVGLSHGLPIKDGRMDLGAFSPEELQMADELASLVHDAGAVTIATGKSITVTQYVQHIVQLFWEKAVKRGKADLISEFDPSTNAYIDRFVVKEEWIDKPTGRMLTDDRQRLTFLHLACDNGGTWFDVFSPDGFMKRTPFQSAFLARLKNPDVTDILQRSVSTSMQKKLELVNAQYLKIFYNGPSWNEAREKTKTYIYASPYGSKFNTRFSLETILADRELKAKWADLTGVDIVDNNSLEHALRRLFHGCSVDIARFEVDGEIGFDIIPEGVNKERTRWEIENHMTDIYTISEREAPTQVHIAIDDGVKPGSNGYHLARAKGGFTPTADVENVAETGHPVSIPAILPQTSNMSFVERSLNLVQAVRTIRYANR